MALMFIGRIGLTSFLFIIGGKEKQPNFHYPKERVIIG
jgi:Trk-type K+ transport system membrane component